MPEVQHFRSKRTTQVTWHSASSEPSSAQRTYFMSKLYSAFFKRSYEYIAIADIKSIPARIKGIYVLYSQESEDQFSVVYIGMARGSKSGARGRIEKHKKSKSNLWTHCSVFEVRDEVTGAQVQELEGLFRHLYCRDPVANRLNKQRGYGVLKKLTAVTLLAASAA